MGQKQRPTFAIRPAKDASLFCRRSRVTQEKDSQIHKKDSHIHKTFGIRFQTMLYLHRNPKNLNIMYVKNTNFVIYLALAAVVGIGAGCFFGQQTIQSRFTSGDISKASVYNNQKEDPSETVVEEKLKNDVSFFNNTKSALSLLKERMNALADLSDRTVRTCDGIEELEPSLETIASLNAKSYNTSMAIDAAVAGLDQVVAGRRTPKYEQASNVAFIGFMKVENQLKAGRTFVEDASAYIQDKDPKDCEEISKLVTEWTVYCTQDAMLRASKDDFKYWHNKVGELSSALALYILDREVLNNMPEWTTEFQKFSEDVETIMSNDLRHGRNSAGLDEAKDVFRSSAAEEVYKLMSSIGTEGMVRNGGNGVEDFMKASTVMDVIAYRAFPSCAEEMDLLGARQVRAMEQFEEVALRGEAR